MKIAIIGAGNMGGAVARGLAKHYSPEHVQITISNRSGEKLIKLKKDCPNISITTNNAEASRRADIIILAVKPWILGDVLTEIHHALDFNHQALVSLAAGKSIENIEFCFFDHKELPPIFRVVPDTGAMVGKSMTFISSRHASESLVEKVKEIFSVLGEVAVIDEKLIPAATALSSCGIAYVYKFVQAYVQAGVQLGFKPADALRYTVATIDGAISLLQANGTLPQEEIDRVTTPGGMTIKGINELEHAGFTSSVIKAILKPLEQ